MFHDKQLLLDHMVFENFTEEEKDTVLNSIKKLSDVYPDLKIQFPEYLQLKIYNDEKSLSGNLNYTLDIDFILEPLSTLFGIDKSKVLENSLILDIVDSFYKNNSFLNIIKVTNNMLLKRKDILQRDEISFSNNFMLHSDLNLFFRRLQFKNENSFSIVDVLKSYIGFNKIEDNINVLYTQNEQRIIYSKYIEIKNRKLLDKFSSSFQVIKVQDILQLLPSVDININSKGDLSLCLNIDEDLIYLDKHILPLASKIENLILNKIHEDMHKTY